MRGSLNIERTVSIIYYNGNSLELKCEVICLPVGQSGRVIIPSEYKKDKSVIAVCDGEIKILNQLGDRTLGDSSDSPASSII